MLAERPIAVTFVFQSMRRLCKGFRIVLRDEVVRGTFSSMSMMFQTLQRKIIEPSFAKSETSLTDLEMSPDNLITQYNPESFAQSPHGLKHKSHCYGPFSKHDGSLLRQPYTKCVRDTVYMPFSKRNGSLRRQSRDMHTTIQKRWSTILPCALVSW